MGKADVVKGWKPAMRDLGFVYRDHLFQLVETKDACLQFGVSIQKNAHADSYKINPSILIRSPFAEAPTQALLVLANLRRDGIRLHVNNESWWPAESLPDALEALKRHALPWFRESGQAAFLAGKLDASIHERKPLIDVLEPLRPDEEEALNRAWPQRVQADSRTPARTFYFASIAHYLAGHREIAIERTRQWLARLSPDDTIEMQQAHAQLAALDRVH